MSRDKILQHKIEYWFDDDRLDLSETDIEHIEQCIKDGYHSGELCQSSEDIEVRGHWKIVNDETVSRERALAIAEKLMEVMTFQRTVEGQYMTDWGLKNRQGVIESIITIITEG